MKNKKTKKEYEDCIIIDGVEVKFVMKKDNDWRKNKDERVLKNKTLHCLSIGKYNSCP